MNNLGNKLFGEVKDLFPFLRSVNSIGNDKTLSYLKKKNETVSIKSFKCNKKYNDWKIPKKWVCSEAFILDRNNKKILDIKKNNLHVLNYSIAVKKTLSLRELKKKIFTIKDQIDDIPYKTSYYKKNWGFCMSYNQYKNLKSGKYNVLINSKFLNEGMSYGEIYIKGKVKKEILLSTNICHPSMASNELSGPVILNNLMKKIQKKNNYFSYRALFIPETIGSIAYINENYERLKKNVFCGLTLTCLGDNKLYSYVKSPVEKSYINQVVFSNFKNLKKKKIFPFTERGSDERNYNAPNVELDIGCITRSKFREYKEYHTSSDNLKFISSSGLINSFKIIYKIIKSIEKNKIKKKYEVTTLGEPKLDKHKLRNSLGAPKKFKNFSKEVIDVWVYCNGKNDDIAISKKTNIKLFKVKNILSLLISKKLVKIKNE